MDRTAAPHPENPRSRISIRLAKRGSLPRVVVAGVLDRPAVGQLSEYLDTLAWSFPGAIELDLAGVRRIDPSGVALLVSVRRRLRGRVAIVPSAAITQTVHYVAEAERNRREGRARE